MELITKMSSEITATLSLEDKIKYITPVSWVPSVCVCLPVCWSVCQHIFPSSVSNDLMTPSKSANTPLPAFCDITIYPTKQWHTRSHSLSVVRQILIVFAWCLRLEIYETVLLELLQWGTYQTQMPLLIPERSITSLYAYTQTVRTYTTAWC